MVTVPAGAPVFSHRCWRPVDEALFDDEADVALARLAGKLAGYADLGPRRAYPVVFRLPGTVRGGNTGGPDASRCPIFPRPAWTVVWDG